MSTPIQYDGIWTALVTPFKNGKIDEAAYLALLERQRDAGVTGVIPCGTTGEAPTLEESEKKYLITTAVKTLAGSGVKVFAGTGSNHTAETVRFSKWASEQGVDGVLVVTPYYNKPTQAGLIAHYIAIADAITVPLMLYQVPGRTGVSFTTDTLSKLSQHPRIRALKEASGHVNVTSELIDQLGDRLVILSGDDSLFLPQLSVGARGVVSVASNLFPKAFVALYRAFQAGQIREASAIHQKYYPLLRDLFLESNPIPIKAAMAELGWCTNELRAPLSPLSDDSLALLRRSLQKCELKKGIPA